ncbi:MAG: RNA polymerase sigma factor [Pseudomonadota bacterium]
MLDETDDNRLALDAAGGDRGAFERLVDRHYDRIHALAWRFTGGPPACEDLAQDVCVALGRKIRSFRGDAKFTTWLYQVVLNAARDGMRKDATRAKATAAFAEVDDLRRGAAADTADKALWLRAALARLKPDLREAAVLVLDEGLSHAEAAEILDVAESTVSWRLMEVRKALKALAAEEGLSA